MYFYETLVNICVCHTYMINVCCKMWYEDNVFIVDLYFI